MSAKLNLLAVQNADVLRAIADDADDQIRTNADLARHLKRDASNLAKTLKALTGEGLLTDKPLHHGLTDEGRAQLAMIGRAEHGGEKRRVRGFWPIDKIRPNPDNRPVDPATIPGLADTVEDKGVLQPALLGPPDASGVRMLLAGERRWRALCHLRAEGRADDKVEQGLPFIELEVDLSTPLLITLIENGQRQDLSPWEDAQQLKALHDATGWSAREIAKKTGRSPADSDTGVRDVQQKIKVAREATPEAIAEYDRTRSWDQLRDSVTKPRQPISPSNPRVCLMIAEAAQVAERLHGVWDGPVPLAPGIGWITPDNDWWSYEAAGTLTLKNRACDWLAAQDFAEDADRVIMRLQSDAGVPHVLPGVRSAADAANPPPSGEGDREAVEGGEAAAPAPNDEAAERLATLESTYTLRNPKQPQGAPLLRIEIGQHADDTWTFATAHHNAAGDGSSYGLSFIGARKRAARSRQEALIGATTELRQRAIDSRPADLAVRTRWLDDVLRGAIQPDAAESAAEPAPSSSGGSRGSQPVPASESASRALAELARWEREAPRNLRRDNCVRIDRLSAWSDPSFRQLKDNGLIRISQVGNGTADSELYATVRSTGREWLATKGTGYVAAVHNSEIWKTPWIAKVADAKADQPEAQLEPEGPSPGADRPADVRKQAAEAMRNLQARWTNYDMAEGETGREEFAQAADAVATPLPWRIDAQGGIVAANGQPIIHGRGDNHPDAPAVTRMRIIVLSVNAMAGLLTPPDDMAGEGGQ